MTIQDATQKLNEISLLQNGLVKIGDDFVKAVSNLENQEDEDKVVEEFMCPECGEWTDSEEPCCGIDQPRYVEDSLNGDR